MKVIFVAARIWPLLTLLGVGLSGRLLAYHLKVEGSRPATERDREMEREREKWLDL